MRLISALHGNKWEALSIYATAGRKGTSGATPVAPLRPPPFVEDIQSARVEAPDRGTD